MNDTDASRSNEHLPLVPVLDHRGSGESTPLGSRYVAAVHRPNCTHDCLARDADTQSLTPWCCTLAHVPECRTRAVGYCAVGGLVGGVVALFAFLMVYFLMLQTLPVVILQAVDNATQRGIPLVTFTTVNLVAYITDSNGVAVVPESAFVGRPVWFSISSRTSRWCVYVGALVGTCGRCAGVCRLHEGCGCATR